MLNKDKKLFESFPEFTLLNLLFLNQVVVFPFVKNPNDVELRRDMKEIFYSEFLDLGSEDPER